MNHQKISLGVLAFALTAAVYFAPAFAVDPADKDVIPRPQAAPKDAAIPPCLEKLALSREQEAKVKDIIAEYEMDLTSVWKEFGDRYMETVRTEALLLAAIEDNLTETQRTQVRAERRKTAQHQKTLAGTNFKPNQSTDKPNSAVEQEIAIIGVVLTAEQELAADKIQGEYLSRLRSLNRDIQGLHTRLVSLEADKMVEIEKVLKKEQLQQLRQIRQNGPIVQKIAAEQTKPAKSR
jgi:hypothetical protein